MGDSDDLSNSFLTYFVLPVALFLALSVVFRFLTRSPSVSFVSAIHLVLICDCVLVHLCSSTTRWFVLWSFFNNNKKWSAVRYLFFLNCVSYLDCECCTYYTWMSTIYINISGIDKVSHTNLLFLSLDFVFSLFIWFRVCDPTKM